MTSQVDPNVVLVYVEQGGNAASVTKEDIGEWLSILGDVSAVKLQYDAALKSNCFHVVFRQRETAQHAVQFLDGQLLKGCTIRIHSRIYSRVSDEADGATLRPTEQSKGTAEAVRVQLPHNHRVPKDVRMDDDLVALLPAIAADDVSYPNAAALWTRLTEAQSQLASVMDAIAAVTDKSDGSRDGGAKWLSADTARNTTVVLSSDDIDASTWFSATQLIPFHRTSPVAFLSSVSEVCGPVSVTHFVPIFGEAGGFSVGVRFWQREDAQLFHGLTVSVDTAPDSKRRRAELSASARDSELLSIVQDAHFVATALPPGGGQWRRDGLNQELLTKARSSLGSLSTA